MAQTRWMVDLLLLVVSGHNEDHTQEQECLQRTSTSQQTLNEDANTLADKLDCISTFLTRRGNFSKDLILKCLFREVCRFPHMLMGSTVFFVFMLHWSSGLASASWRSRTFNTLWMLRAKARWTNAESCRLPPEDVTNLRRYHFTPQEGARERMSRGSWAEQTSLCVLMWLVVHRCFAQTGWRSAWSCWQDLETAPSHSLVLPPPLMPLCAQCLLQLTRKLPWAISQSGPVNAESRCHLNMASYDGCLCRWIKRFLRCRQQMASLIHWR